MHSDSCLEARRGGAWWLRLQDPVHPVVADGGVSHSLVELVLGARGGRQPSTSEATGGERADITMSRPETHTGTKQGLT